MRRGRRVAVPAVMRGMALGGRVRGSGSPPPRWLDPDLRRGDVVFVCAVCLPSTSSRRRPGSRHLSHRARFTLRAPPNPWPGLTRPSRAMRSAVQASCPASRAVCCDWGNADGGRGADALDVKVRRARGRLVCTALRPARSCLHSGPFSIERESAAGGEDAAQHDRGGEHQRDRGACERVRHDRRF